MSLVKIKKSDSKITIANAKELVATSSPGKKLIRQFANHTNKGTDMWCKAFISELYKLTGLKYTTPDHAELFLKASEEDTLKAGKAADRTLDNACLLSKMNGAKRMGMRVVITPTPNAIPQN